MERNEREERVKEGEVKKSFLIEFFKEVEKGEEEEWQKSIAQKNNPVPREKALLDKRIHEEEKSRTHGKQNREISSREEKKRRTRKEECEP